MRPGRERCGGGRLSSSRGMAPGIPYAGTHTEIGSMIGRVVAECLLQAWPRSTVGRSASDPTSELSHVSSSRAKAIAILGPAPDVGKSMVAAELYRLLHRAGIAWPPLKAQTCR